jgi:Uma2 family endonuclease
MMDAGILLEDERVELIEGEIIQMSPIGGRHVWCLNVLNSLLVSAIGSAAWVSPQNPIRLNDGSEPQPDIALLRRRNYSGEIPVPDDVYILIEVADTSFEDDQFRKLHLYGAARIPEVWIVDLNNEVVSRYTDPTIEGFNRAQDYRRGQRLVSDGVPDRAIIVEVDELFTS